MGSVINFLDCTLEGIGVDIEDVSRFREKGYWKNRSFYEKIFNDEEIEYCINKPDPSLHFAVRFCAKEAFIKATKLTIKDYREIKVTSSNGKPCIYFNGKKELISLAHEKDKAIAFVVIKNERK